MSIPSGTFPADMEPLGNGLQRPECVLGSPQGDVFVSDWGGGVLKVCGDGSQMSWLAQKPSIDLRPNGIAIAPDGSFLIANLGDEGGVWRLNKDGSLVPLLTEVDGIQLPPANYVTLDEQGRIWISVSTRLRPRQLAWRNDVADGFIVLIDGRGARIVADGLRYTNECRPDPSGKWLYVVETFGRRLVRFPISVDGALGLSETTVSLGPGCWPDGFAFDEEYGIWITSLVSNGLFRFDGGSLETIIEETNRDFVEEVEQAFLNGNMRTEHLGTIPGTRLQHITSVGFGGADLRTVYIGCLHNDCIFKFRSKIPGAQPPHWKFCLP